MLFEDFDAGLGSDQRREFYNNSLSNRSKFLGPFSHPLADRPDFFWQQSGLSLTVD
jgi:hypothetical protein